MWIKSLIQKNTIAAPFREMALPAPSPPWRGSFQPCPLCTFLTVSPHKAQGAITVISLLPGLAAGQVVARIQHAGMRCIIQVHNLCQVWLQVDGSVIEDELEDRKCKEIQAYGDNSFAPGPFMWILLGNESLKKGEGPISVLLAL